MPIGGVVEFATRYWRSIDSNGLDVPVGPPQQPTGRPATLPEGRDPHKVIATRRPFFPNLHGLDSNPPSREWAYLGLGARSDRCFIDALET